MSSLPSDITVPGRPEVHEVSAGVYAYIQPDGPSGEFLGAGWEEQDERHEHRTRQGGREQVDVA